MNMMCGSVILNEYQMYTFYEMFQLFLALCLSVVGIIILVKKPDLIQFFKLTSYELVTSVSHNGENDFKRL
jgi:hypothetical protein